MPIFEGLTLKQKRFADEYIKTGNGTQSALNAYDTNSNTAGVIASENLRKPSVEAYIAKRMNARELSREYVLNKLIDELEDKNEDNPVVRVKVLELLGKALRMYSEKQIDENEITRIKAISWGKPKETVKPIPEDNEPIEIKAE